MKVGLLTDTSRHLNTDGKEYAGVIFLNSPLFRYSLDYCKKNYDEIHVLSVKYGMVDVNEKIESYEESIHHKSKKDMELWLENTSEQIRKRIPKGSELYFHTGLRYRRLIPLLEGEYPCFEPMRGLGIGQMLQKYKKLLKNSKK